MRDKKHTEMRNLTSWTLATANLDIMSVLEWTSGSESQFGKLFGVDDTLFNSAAAEQTKKKARH
jgi:hypothetical protein